MSASVLASKEVRTAPATVRPYLLGGLAALSVGAAAIHFAVMFEHFAEYTLYGVFFLVISWAQVIWPAVLLWRPSRFWLWLGIAGNASVIAVYVASRTAGLPFGPDLHNPESVGALDVVSCILEFGLIIGCAALLWRPSLADRPVARRGAVARAVALDAVPAAVIATATAVMTPGWAGPEGPAGMASGMYSQSASSLLNSGMGDMGTTDGHQDMQMYGSTAPPTASQVLAAAQLVKATDASLRRYTNVQAAFAAGYTYVLKTNAEEHLLYDGGDPSYQGLNPRDPSSLVHAINVPNHAPILLGAMYIMGDQQNGPQIGGGLTRWHSHLVTCDQRRGPGCAGGAQLTARASPGSVTVASGLNYPVTWSVSGVYDPVTLLYALKCRCDGMCLGGRSMTSSVGVSPGPVTRAPAAQRGWPLSRLDTATTPGRLGLLLVGLVLLSLAWGILAALTAEQHASAASDVVAVSEPLSLDAEQVYQSLSDADATAATAFLSGGLESAADLQRYNADIAQAAIRIEAASALLGSSAARTQLPGQLNKQAAAAGSATGDDLAILSAGLPVYADEVGTARADNRLGLPLGAAYLREASTLLRGTLLTAASDIYTKENGLLTSASAQATGLPLVVIAVVIGLGLGFLLYRSSRWLTRRTHRRVNYGLLVAAVAFAVSLVWLAGAFAVGRAELLHAQQRGSAPAEAFARADVAALQAHADESLTLIDNSGDDSYQQDFIAQQKLLGPGPGTLLAAGQASAGNGSAAADAQAWYRAHAALRALDDGGNHAAAVQSALNGQAAVTFARLSADLSDGINAHQAVFASDARGGRDAFTGLAAGMIVASLIMAAGCARGLNRRLAEYR